MKKQFFLFTAVCLVACSTRFESDDDADDVGDAVDKHDRPACGACPLP